MALVAWLALTRSGRRAASVANVGISTLGQRLGSSAVIVVGIAGVVGVLVAMLAMAEGYAETLRKTGSLDTAIVMRGASASEVISVGVSPDGMNINEECGSTHPASIAAAVRQYRADIGISLDGDADRLLI